jgi:peroxiredoxin
MMKEHERVFSIFLIGLVLVLMNPFILLSRVDASSHYMDRLGIKRFYKRVKAPSFSLKDINGAVVRLEDYRGKIVFLNFWATWCRPCRVEMPSMEKLYTEFRNQDFIMLAVDLRESARKVKSFGDTLGLSYPLLLDSNGSVGDEYGVRSIPTTYLIDREGYFIGGAVGARDWASNESFGLIDQLLNSSPDS